MQLQLRVTAILGLAAVLAAGVWAGRPLARPAVPAMTVEDAEAAPDQGEARFASLDTSAFGAVLWREPVTAAKAKPSSKPPPPLRLQLIGIIDSGQELRAALYDPDSDRLLIVSNGDQLGQHTITSIQLAYVEISDGSRTHRILLQEDQS